MQIDIKHIAKLSRLKIEDEKLNKFETEMQNIIGMVEKLPSLEDKLSGVDVNNTMELREDVVQPSLKRDEILKNAPQTQAGCVVVPKTVE